jgi:hypothetical protein
VAVIISYFNGGFMMNGKCGCMKLCPVSFGLALGLTAAFGFLIWTAWIMYQGMPPMMEGMPLPTWSGAGMHAFWMLVKGFIFGFAFALIYDFVACCMAKCCKKSTSCCNTDSK